MRISITNTEFLILLEICVHASMGIYLGDIFPNFEAESTAGTINLHNWLGKSWGILMYHPADFKPVSTTELGRAISVNAEFERRDVKLIAVSGDTVDSHTDWIKDIQFSSGVKEFVFPILADPNLDLSVKLGLIDPDTIDQKGATPSGHAVFIIGPDKKLKLFMVYPHTTGINFSEILRLVDSLQLAPKQVATPADWTTGSHCLATNLNEEAQTVLYPKGVTTIDLPSGKKYLVMTPYPGV